MKKITIVYERNEETNAIELRTIVIFDEGKAPVVRDYHGKESLYEAASFVESNGYDVVEEANVRKAIEDGLISIISRADVKAMADLRSEILQETAKYGVEKEKVETREVAEEKVEDKEEEKKTAPKTRKVRRLNLSPEDKGLADYFRLELESSKRELTKDELGHLMGLVRENERVRALEEAKSRLANKEPNMTQKQYDALHDRYRAELAEAFKNADYIEEEIPVEEETEERAIAPEEEPKTVKVKQLNLSKEDRDLVNYLKLVILRNRRELTAEENNRLATILLENERARTLETAKEKLKNHEISEEEYERIHATYRAQLAEAFKNAEKRKLKNQKL